MRSIQPGGSNTTAMKTSKVSMKSSLKKVSFNRISGTENMTQSAKEKPFYSFIFLAFFFFFYPEESEKAASQ